MVLDNTNGKMEECMSVNINMIRSMDLGLILGLMVESMLDNGLIVSDMEKERFCLLMVHKDKEFGNKIEG